jgi:hypothetical protein
MQTIDLRSEGFRRRQVSPEKDAARFGDCRSEEVSALGQSLDTALELGGCFLAGNGRM